MNRIDKYICYLVTILILISTTYLLTVIDNLNIMSYFFVVIIDLLLLYNELFSSKDNLSWTLIRIIGIFLLSFYLWLSNNDYVILLYFIIPLFQIIRVFKLYLYYWSNFLVLIMTNFSVIIKHADSVVLWEKIIKTDSIIIISNFFIYILYIMIKQNEELNKNKKKLLEENLKNEYAYEQLKRAYSELENYTVLKERDRIAREMHDTVGHNLTITLVQLENYGIDNVKNENREEYSEIVEGVRKALYNIRTTVHKTKEVTDWWQEIDNLISNIKDKKLISINYSRDDFYNISIDKVKCIFNIVQEGITNGIRHGNATAFIIAIKDIDNNIITRVINNGVSQSAFKKGFGLLSMEEKILNLNGRLDIESSLEEGFTLSAYLPKGD